MTPLALALKTLRFRKGLRQQVVAERACCDRGHLSGLENDLKPTPSPEFLERLILAMDLSEKEANELRTARKKSRRNYTLPSDLPEEAYELAYRLFARLDTLSASHVRALIEVLGIECVDAHSKRKKRRPAATDLNPTEEGEIM
jgi:transcriptional regulator with XRE-family HTH domain